MQAGLRDLVGRRAGERDADLYTYQAVEETFPEPVASINFALDHGVTSILPAAFYRLSFTRLDYEWESVHEPHFHSDEPIPSARWSLLDRETLFRLFKGKADLSRLLKQQLESLSLELFEPARAYGSPNCRYLDTETPGRCTGQMWEMGRGFMSLAMRDKSKFSTTGFGELDCLAILKDFDG